MSVNSIFLVFVKLNKFVIVVLEWIYFVGKLIVVEGIFLCILMVFVVLVLFIEIYFWNLIWCVLVNDLKYFFNGNNIIFLGLNIFNKKLLFNLDIEFLLWILLSGE